VSYIWLDYFDWLCDIVHANEQTLYWNDILWELYNTNFVVVIKRDNNRVDDAYALRDEFMYGHSGHQSDFLDTPPSLLEVLIALARRGEIEIMHDPELGDRTPKWFWTMLFNLGLDEFAYMGALNDPENDLKMAKIVDNFMYKKHSRDGNGGIFLAKSGQIDMRKEELWNQMCYYFDQFF